MFYEENRMLNIVVLDSATLGEDIDLSPLDRNGSVTEYKNTAPDMIAERVNKADVVILNKLKLGAHNLSGAENLKLICVTATGYDNIDTEYCRAHGIALCNVPAYSTDSVAQLSVAMALYLANHLGEYRAYVASGEYSESGVANRLTPVYHEISSMTWGIVGGGNIGSRVAEVASAFGCKVLMCRRKADPRYENADIDSLCERADIISVHVPLSDETRGLISRERIAKMKNSAIFINVARGAVANEEALVEAIKENRLGGLGVDVYTKEPFDSDHPYNEIKDHPNVCLTPHMAWGSFEARTRCIEVVSDNISSFFGGETKNRIV